MKMTDRSIILLISVIACTTACIQAYTTSYQLASNLGFGKKGRISVKPLSLPFSYVKCCRSLRSKFTSYCSAAEPDEGTKAKSSEKIVDPVVHFDQETEQSNWIRCEKDLNIILVGNPMVGKSTLANIVSRKLNMTMVDVDDHVHMIGRYAPDDAHARILESILNREHYTTRQSVGGIVVACGGYMINRIDVVNVLLRAKREGHLIFHLQRKRFWQSTSRGKYTYGWPFLDLSHVPFSQAGKEPKILSGRYFTEERLKQLTENIYATRPREKELKTGTFTPYFPSKRTTADSRFPTIVGNELRSPRLVLNPKPPVTAATAATALSAAAPTAAPPFPLSGGTAEPAGARAPTAAAGAASGNTAADAQPAAAAATATAAATAPAAAAAAGDPGARTRAWLAEQMESSKFSEEIEALYRKARTHQFFAIHDATRAGKGNAELAARDFYTAVYRLARLGRAPVTLGGLVVSLTSKSVTELIAPGRRDRLSEMLVGAEAVELRVDMLATASYASREYIKAQYGLLRRHCRLPVIWTVRSRRHGGEFRRGEDEYVLLVKLGAELGAEFIEVETCWSAAAQANIARSRRQAVVVASHTETREGFHPAGSLAAQLARMAASACGGRADVVKLVVESSDPRQVDALRAALAAHAAAAAAPPPRRGGGDRRPGDDTNGRGDVTEDAPSPARPTPPAVGLCVGRHYARSVIANRVMSFCSLYSPRGLPPAAADVLRARAAEGIFTPRRLAVVAAGPADGAAAAAVAADGGRAAAEAVAAGLRATLAAAEMPIQYDVQVYTPAGGAAVPAPGGVTGSEVGGGQLQGGMMGGGGDGWPAAEISEMLRDADTGGVVIAEPAWRRPALALADTLTPAAIYIGEVNLLRPRPLAGGGEKGGAMSVLGDNTEWLAVRAALRRAVTECNVRQPAAVAVVGPVRLLRACLYTLDSLPDATVAKSVTVYTVDEPPPATHGPSEYAAAAAAAVAAADELAQDFQSCRAAAGGAAALTAAGGNPPAAGPFDIIISYLPPGDPARIIPDSLLTRLAGGGPVVVIEALPPTSLFSPPPGPPSAAAAAGGDALVGRGGGDERGDTLAARCAAAGAVWMGPEEVLRESSAAVGEYFSLGRPAALLADPPPATPAESLESTDSVSSVG